MAKKYLAVSEIPEMMAQCHPAKNTVDLSEISGKNRDIKLIWCCPECGHEWEGTPRSRMRANYVCPACKSGKRILKGVNDVLTLVPELGDTYDPEKNEGIDIYAQGVDSRESVVWHCPECQRIWTAQIRNRIRRVGENQYKVIGCSHPRKSSSENIKVTMVSEVPEMYKFWDCDKNAVDPFATSSNDSNSAFWKCPKCGHEWVDTIRHRRNSSNKCPCCELNLVRKWGVNDIFTLVPEAKESYDFEKNKDIDILSLNLRSSVPLRWKCPDCGREWKSTLASRLRKADDGYHLARCQKCYWTDPSRRISVAEVPELMLFWDTEENEKVGLNANVVSSNSMEIACWKCQKCGYRWKASIKSRYYVLPKCRNCDLQKAIIPGVNDVLTLVPDLSKIYDFEKNTHIDINFLGTSSSKKAFFKCPSCHNEWESRILDRVAKNSDGTWRIVDCPSCGKLGRRTQTYAQQYPELDDMFDEEKNGRTLASVKSVEANTVKFWWNCKTCKKSFDARLNAMIVAQGVKSKGCPYCAHAKLCAENSFAALHPEYMDEYSDQNEINPFEVFQSDERKVIWVCRNDSSHVWKASFIQRHLGEGRCPVCNRSSAVKGINSFADIYPQFVDMWSPRNNGSPEKTLYDASTWLWWVCPTCKKEYGAIIKDVVSGEISCPHCRRLKASFAANHEKLMDEWDCVGNYLIADPERIADSSTTQVWWRCPADESHLYLMSPSRRLMFEKRNWESCPYCKGFRRKKRHFI